jgi:transcriptional regulator with PAS, ATPase and Fis domain
MSTAHPVLSLPEQAPLLRAWRAKAMVIADEASCALLDTLERVAPSEAPVLIIGETGTGKEILARRLHESSRRRGPFIAVNCGAISETLAESEFFGHETGAFTGAGKAREGYFEAAEGGTLFLDEIGELPLAMQTRLLRVLQEKEVVRIGARRPTPIDVRIVAATNVDLQAAVQSGRFRRDLFYRINIITLPVAPLRARRGDILPLAEHFLTRYRERLGLEQAELTTAARNVLLDHSWPGNIRELENVIHAALLMAYDGIIAPEHLLLEQEAAPEPTVWNNPTASPATAPATDPDALIRAALDSLLAEATPDLHARLELLIVRTVLDAHRYNQVRSAEALGISRHALRTLMKRYGLLNPPTPTRTEQPWNIASLATAI